MRNQYNIFNLDLNLPEIDLKLIKENGILKIYDLIRDKYVCLTPEEFVRQHFVNWLIKEKKFPKSLIANEIGINVNGTKKRCDTVVFDNTASPMMIVEYKSPYVQISQDVFDQIVRYNMALHAMYLVVSNGRTHYCCRLNYKNNSYSFIPIVPCYSELISSQN